MWGERLVQPERRAGREVSIRGRLHSLTLISAGIQRQARLESPRRRHVTEPKQPRGRRRADFLA